jgi:hypothetical protein
LTGSTTTAQSASSPGYQYGRLSRKGEILTDIGCARIPEYGRFERTSVAAAAEPTGRRATLSALRIATKEDTAECLTIEQGSPIPFVVWCGDRNGSTEADGPQLNSISDPALHVTDDHGISTGLTSVCCEKLSDQPALPIGRE